MEEGLVSHEGSSSSFLGNFLMNADTKQSDKFTVTQILPVFQIF